MDRKDGRVRDRPAVLLRKHVHELWPDGDLVFPTSSIGSALVEQHPEEWGIASPFGQGVDRAAPRQDARWLVRGQQHPVGPQWTPRLHARLARPGVATDSVERDERRSAPV